METLLLIYILLLPVCGALINGLLSFFGENLQAFTKRHWGWSEELFLKKTSVVSAWVGVSVIFLAFAVGLWCFIQLAGLPAGATRRLTQSVFTWIHSGALHIDFALQFDVLSSLMVLVVTGVGALIHLYSVGYMHGDKGFCRFFAYLNFFIFAMLILVLGNSLPILFIGWEGVGLASYLLIGFWFEDPDKAKAGKKAFITNRIGDLGFILGILLLFALLSKHHVDKITLSFDQIAQFVATGTLAPLYITIAALLLFWGACGKSAQLPLYVWLPDAMAGPTPVSALIHAATMVTAGVYMVVRLSALYFASSTAMAVVAIVGAITALFAGTIGLVQNDIKKVLAYSTVSQLGYMFLACGVGAPIIAMFHLITHAFFKACLFLGAGSVIHNLGGKEQNIQHMGGLKTRMPETFWPFLVATLAIAGIPPLAGFFSKDEILYFAWGNSRVLWTVAALAALCTSFYMFRLCYLTFAGENRTHDAELHDKEHHDEKLYHEHRTPWTMSLVLAVLAGLAAVGGLIGVPHIMGGSFHFPNYLEEWLHPLVPAVHVADENPMLPWGLMAVSVVIALAGLLLAHYLYGKKSDVAERLAAKFAGLYRLLSAKYFVDEIYEKCIFHPLYLFSEKILFRCVDKKGIDATVNFSGRLCQAVSRQSLKLQQGDVQYYLFYIMVGLLVFSAVIFFNL